jgi:transposase
MSEWVIGARPFRPASPDVRNASTRYHQLAANYLAFIQLASIRLWLRANESTP